MNGQVAPEVIAWAREFHAMLIEDHPEIDALALTQGPYALHVTKTSARVAGPGGLVDLTPELSGSRTSDSLRRMEERSYER